MEQDQLSCRRRDIVSCQTPQIFISLNYTLTIVYLSWLQYFSNQAYCFWYAHKAGILKNCMKFIMKKTEGHFFQSFCSVKMCLYTICSQLNMKCNANFSTDSPFPQSLLSRAVLLLYGTISICGKQPTRYSMQRHVTLLTHLSLLTATIKKTYTFHWCYHS